jgi:hypothetical protein
MLLSAIGQVSDGYFSWAGGHVCCSRRTLHHEDLGRLAREQELISHCVLREVSDSTITLLAI